MRGSIAAALAACILCGCGTVRSIPRNPYLDTELERIRTTRPTYPYTVRKGDTLWSISRKFHVSIPEIVMVNGVDKTASLKEGTVLAIPYTTTPPTPPVRREVQRLQEKRTAPNPVSAKGWMWPVKGEITVPFGTRTNGLITRGVEIRTKSGTPVVASRDGTVRKAGDFTGLGKTVVIEHGGGVYITMYGRNGEIVVKEGQHVKQGQVIAYARRTKKGRTFIHFRLFRRGRAVDPARYLLPRL